MHFNRYLPFGAFLALLIIIVIMIYITLYSKVDVIPVRLVAATVPMAISLNLVIFNFEEMILPLVFATGVLNLAWNTGVR